MGDFVEGPLLLQSWPSLLAHGNGEGRFVRPLRNAAFAAGFLQPALDAVAFVRRHPRIHIRLRLIEAALVDW